MPITIWLTDNWIELFGAATGIIYVFLEIRQNLWLWPVGIITSAVYIFVFLTGKLYADMSLQGYYLFISVLGWYWWVRGRGRRAQGAGQEVNGPGRRAPRSKSDEVLRSGKDKGKEDVHAEETVSEGLKVTGIKLSLAIILTIVFLGLFLAMYFILSRLTDSPVPGWDAFLTSLSIIATWMLARKIYEHWYLWIIVNSISSAFFLSRELYPTMILYLVYCIMSFAGLRAWKRTL